MGPQPGPRLVEVKTGGSGEGRLPVGINTANRLTTNRFFTSPFQPPSFPSLTCQLQVPRPPPSLRLRPLQRGPWALPWPGVAKGTEAPPRSRCAPPPRPHPDMGNKVQRRQKNDTQPTRAGTVPAAGLGPQSRNRVSAWLPHPPQFCELGLPLPKIAQKLVAPVEWGDRIPSLGWLVGSL